jgi:signal transduction histidine kinase/ActR/RegA family two-component response regulator
MNTQAVADLCSRLAAAVDAPATGSALAEAFVREWGADAALVWLPATVPHDARPEDHLFVSGDALAASPVTGLLADLQEHHVARRLADRGLPASCVVDFLPPQGGRMAVAWCDATAVPPHVGATLSVIAAHVSLLRDQRQCEERLAAATAALLEAEDQISRTRRVRALGEMASGVVHDFNNALTSILGFTELALGPLEKGDAFFNDLSSIRMAALDAAALVRRLQTFGRKGHNRDEREVADLKEVVRVMPSLVRPRWMKLSQVQGIAFDIVIDARPVPPVHVVVAEIRELLLNLLFNAIDAMPSGGRITLATGSAPDGGALITVTDEGIGMSSEVSQQIFHPFFSTKGDRGSGLGLNVCQTIAGRHGGQLVVQSAPGAGTTFTLSLPSAPPELVAAFVTQTVSIDPRPMDTQRILLVDDQEEVRESVGEMLRAMGHHVTVADSGEAAISLVSRQRIDVVITDVGMPGMNGLALAQRLLVLTPRVPVILLTGWELESDSVRPGNVVFVLGKPVTMKSLRDALGAGMAEPVDKWNEKCS